MSSVVEEKLRARCRVWSIATRFLSVSSLRTLDVCARTVQRQLCEPSSCFPEPQNSLTIIRKEHTEDSQWRNSTTSLIKACKETHFHVGKPSLKCCLQLGKFDLPSVCSSLSPIFKNKRPNSRLHGRKISMPSWLRDQAVEWNHLSWNPILAT